ncbi:MAG: copper-binding protein [Deltaproteobacteria bacterium]|jgi:Cu(I)/Ag(I) efflux system protein CusF|nr:copper-binding protein [Deltaproteobacteria bacterium]
MPKIAVFKNALPKPQALFPALRLALLSLLWLSLAAASQALAQDHSGHGGHGAAAPAETDFPSAIYSTTGKVMDIDLEGKRIVIDHGPIDAVGWGPMVMGFNVEESALLEEVEIGSNVRLDIRFDSPTSYLIVDLENLD